VPDLWRRTLAIVLDGLRSVHEDELPGTAPSSSQLARMISRQSAAESKDAAEQA